MLTDRYIVLRSDSYMPDLGDAYSGARTFANPDIPGALSVTVEDLSPADLADARRSPGVRAIAPPMPVRLIRPYSATNNASTISTWGVEAVGADSSPYTGQSVSMAILDTGIDRQHAAFKGMEIIERDFTGEGTGDLNGHGTHVAGTAFGQDVGGVRIGVARGVSSALIGKVLDGQGAGSTEGIYQAILWADQQGADVVSMSLGIDFPGYVRWLTDRGFPIELATSRALVAFRTNVRLFDALAEALRARAMLDSTATVVTAAAGNESRADEDSNWKIGVAPPAAADGFVSIGAIGAHGSSAEGYFIAPFSNTGPNVVGPGVSIVSARAGTADDLVAFSGTSMATPHVAGVAALWGEQIVSEAPSTPLSHARLGARLLGSARRVEGIDPLDQGLGLVRAPQ